MIKTSIPSAEWLEKANKNGFTRNYVFDEGRLEGLKNILLDIGGWSVVLPRLEPDFLKLLTRGRRFAGRSTMMKGESSQCHLNSACLWDANKETVYLCTGYALSKDGVWRQHSWCAHPTKRSWRVVETTQKRVQYFGYIMHHNEAERFLFDNM
jgi:hypothetical protein